MKFLDQNCPFVHDRHFRTFLFSSPMLRSFDDLSKTLFDDNLSKGEHHSGTSGDFRVQHRFYFADENYTSNETDRRACYSKWNNPDEKSYRYTLFLAQSNVIKPPAFLIIVPLMKMARALYPALEKRSLGQNVTYWKINLHRLISGVKSGAHLGGNLAVRQIRYSLVGDPKASSLILAGSDVPSCVSLRRIDPVLEKEGIRRTARSVSLVFRDQVRDQRFSISINNAGHLSFFVDEGAENFPLLGTMLKYFSTNELIESCGFPSFKRTPESSDTQEPEQEEENAL